MILAPRGANEPTAEGVEERPGWTPEVTAASRGIVQPRDEPSLGDVDLERITMPARPVAPNGQAVLPHGARWRERFDASR